MSVFSINNQGRYFDQGNWEKAALAQPQFENAGFESAVDNQFVLLQLSGGEERVNQTTAVIPKLQGAQDKPDINMMLDFEGFKIAGNENIDRNTKATLQLQIGQEQKIGALEKLFYSINGGLDLFNTLKNKKAEAKDFKKSTDQALGNKPISLPGGVGQISLKVVKHEEPKWWQKVFSFAKTDTAKDLFSLVGFPGITASALSCVGNMLDNLLEEEPEILFQSQPVKLAFTQAAKDDLNGDLDINRVSCLNPGFWVMARKSDFKKIIELKPIYFSGFGLLAPDGMSEIDALQDGANNPFSQMTYAIIRARMKEVDLKQGLLI